jgi:LPXTG-motif cell wall-anchored protein
MKRERLALYGLIFAIIGIASYLFGVLMAIPRRMFFNGDFALRLNEALVWYSGIPVLLGLTLILLDLFVLFPKKRKNEYILYEPLTNKMVTVVLTAYNDDI